jgi:hypothetical protein
VKIQIVPKLINSVSKISGSLLRKFLVSCKLIVKYTSNKIPKINFKITNKFEGLKPSAIKAYPKIINQGNVLPL